MNEMDMDKIKYRKNQTSKNQIQKNNEVIIANKYYKFIRL